MNYKTLSKIISGSLLCTMTLYTIPVMAYTKDETIYSKHDIEGNNYQTIVSTHLKNTQNEEVIKDISDLLNIKNTNGEETYEQTGENIIWKANKNDIYYQGESEKQLPIECEITYELNGKEISADEIAGKSGNVKITINYKNKDEHTVNINGKNEKIYTPFVIIAGTIIENENNKNITITKGKVIDDGTKTILVGIALPGLQESLKISEKQMEIPNSIEISMETTKFEMGSIMNFVTPKLLQSDETNIKEQLKGITDKIEILETSANQLEEGATKLQEGTNEYSEKMNQFETAMEQITNGMNNAASQYSILNSYKIFLKTCNFDIQILIQSCKEDLSSNISKINEGIKTLNASSTELNEGAKQITEGIDLVGQNIKLINEKLQVAQSGATKIKLGQNELVNGIDKILNQLELVTGQNNTNQIEQLKQLIQKNKEAINNLQETNKLLNEDESNEVIQSQINANNEMISLLQANNVAQNSILEALIATDSSSIEALKLALQQIKTGLTSLNEGTVSLETGLTSLTTGTTTLNQKTQELLVGANTLYQGTNTLRKSNKYTKIRFKSNTTWIKCIR